MPTSHWRIECTLSIPLGVLECTWQIKFLTFLGALTFPQNPVSNSPRGLDIFGFLNTCRVASNFFYFWKKNLVFTKKTCFLRKFQNYKIKYKKSVSLLLPVLVLYWKLKFVGKTWFVRKQIQWKLFLSQKTGKKREYTYLANGNTSHMGHGHQEYSLKIDLRF